MQSRPDDLDAPVQNRLALASNGAARPEGERPHPAPPDPPSDAWAAPVDTLHGGFGSRVLAVALAAELPYALLAPFGFVYLTATPLSDRSIVIRLLLVLTVAKFALLAAALSEPLRPIERWLAFHQRGAQAPTTVVVAAARAASRIPLSFSLVWAASWAVLYGGVGCVRACTIPTDARLVAAAILFAVACFAAALLFAHSILDRLVSPVRLALSMEGRHRDLSLPTRELSFETRMLAMAVCLAGAPTAWLGALAFSHLEGMAPHATALLALFIFVPLVWAPLATAFVARSASTRFRHVASAVEQLLRDGRVERLEHIPVFQHDEIGRLAVTINAMFDRLQQTSERIRTDSAERERLSNDAAKRAAQLEAVLNNIVEAVFVCDGDGRLTLLNASAQRLLSLPERPASADPPKLGDVAEFRRIRRADGVALSPDELPLARALAGEIILDQEQIVRLPGGAANAFLRTSAAPIRNARGAVVGAVAVSRDVTEANQLERLKHEFLRVAAHELKTPITIIKGYALMLLRAADTLDAGERQMLDAINRGTDRMTAVVDDLLTASQALLDLLEFSPERVDLGELVGDVASRLEVHSPTHRIVVRCISSEPIRVHADAKHVRQALESLIENAIKYSPGGREIDVRVERDDRRAEARVLVHDTGVGIPEGKRASVFELFYGAHTDTPYDYGGLGVGLYLAKHLIARQNGRIWFETEEGRGSTFGFSLPLA